MQGYQRFIGRGMEKLASRGQTGLFWESQTFGRRAEEAPPGLLEAEADHGRGHGVWRSAASFRGIRRDTVSCGEVAHFDLGPRALHCDVTGGGAAPSPGAQLALIIPPASGPSPSLPSPPSTTATYHAGYPQRRQSHQARHVHLKIGVNVYSPGRSFISILQSFELVSKMKKSLYSFICSKIVDMLWISFLFWVYILTSSEKFRKGYNKI